jgi:hypothetical protein
VNPSSSSSYLFLPIVSVTVLQSRRGKGFRRNGGCYITVTALREGVTEHFPGTGTGGIRWIDLQRLPSAPLRCVTGVEQGNGR